MATPFLQAFPYCAGGQPPYPAYPYVYAGWNSGRPGNPQDNNQQNNYYQPPLPEVDKAGIAHQAFENMKNLYRMDADQFVRFVR